MARLFTAGAEEGSYRALIDLWNAGQLGSYTLVSSPGMPRTGNYCYYLAGSGAQLRAAIPCSTSDLYMGFACYLTNFGNTYNAYRGANLIYFPFADCGITIVPGYGMAGFYGSTLVGPTFSVPINAWFYVELYIKPMSTSGGRLTIKINGATVCDVTQQTASATVNPSQVYIMAPTGMWSSTWYYQNAYFDDIVVNDTSGATNNSWPGMVRLFPILTRGVGDLQQMSRKGLDLGYNNGQTREAGSGISWLEGSSSGLTDLSYMDAPTLPAGAAVSNIIVEVHSRTQLGAATVKPVLKSGSTQSDGAAIAAPASWGVQQQAWPLDPATGSAWTLGALATIQAGAKIG